jgi:outer membrane protein OmpA-like peptidoglycan-associated protein
MTFAVRLRGVISRSTAFTCLFCLLCISRATPTLRAQNSAQTIPLRSENDARAAKPAQMSEEEIARLAPVFPLLRFGVFGAANWSFHVADFPALPSVPVRLIDFTPDVLSFGSALALTPAFGAALEYAFSPFIGFSARLGYASHPALFQNADSYPLINPLTGEESLLTSTVSLRTGLSSLALEPSLFVSPFANLGLKIYAGARVGYLLTRDFTQSERLSSNDPTFETGAGERNFREGKIPRASDFALGAMAGVGYEIPIEGVKFADGMGRLSVQPEVFGVFGLNPVVEGLSWNIHQIRAGVSLFYRQEEMLYRFEERREVDTIIVRRKQIRIPFMVGISTFSRDTIFTAEDGKRVRTITETLRRVDTAFAPPPPVMDVDITAAGVNEKGEQKNLVQMRVEEFIVQRYVPLLNYIFFDEASSDLPPRYSRLNPQTASVFDIDRLYQQGTLDIYRHALNIVGKRMRQYPDAVLTLTGCNADLGAEAGNVALSAARAESVRQYLVETWNIAGNRIILKARNLSEDASLPKTDADKTEENRRVEIASTVKEILDPILLSDTMRVSNPPTIRFFPKIDTKEPVRHWTLTAFSGNKDFVTFSSSAGATTSEGKDLPERIDWTPPQQGEGSLDIDAALEFTLNARDAEGKSGFAHGFIPVQKIVLPDKKIEQFSLVLFGFNKAQITEQHQRMINVIKSVVRPNSKVAISGYTDRTGDSAYNKTLSRQRAAELARLLDQPLSKAQGYGEDTLLYDNDTPEGRFYCRTVNVSVETSK